MQDLDELIESNILKTTDLAVPRVPHSPLFVSSCSWLLTNCFPCPSPDACLWTFRVGGCAQSKLSVDSSAGSLP